MAGFLTDNVYATLTSNGDAAGVGYVSVLDASEIFVGAIVSLRGITAPPQSYLVVAVNTVYNLVGLRAIYPGTPHLNGQIYGLTSVAQYTVADGATLNQPGQFVYGTRQQVTSDHRAATLQLVYGDQRSQFTVGETILGAPSGQRGVVWTIIENSQSAGVVKLLSPSLPLGNDFYTDSTLTGGEGGRATTNPGQDDETFSIDYHAVDPFNGFTIGKILTGATSGATANVTYADNANDGTAEINAILGTFEVGETLTDEDGNTATATSPQYLYLDYRNMGPGTFTAKQVVTGLTSGATGLIVSDDTNLGTLHVLPLIGTFQVSEYVFDGLGGKAQINSIA